MARTLRMNAPWELLVVCLFLCPGFGNTSQDVFDHDKGQKSVISGLRLHWIFVFFSPLDFSFSPGCLCSSVSQRKTKGGGKLRGGEDIP